MSKIIGEEISVDQANGYISSFIQKYYATGKFPVKSFSINADLVRNYLNTYSELVADIKIVMAEAPDEDGNMYPTLVLVGYTSNGDYVVTSDMKVLDHCAACPPRCPSGAAASDLITISHFVPPTADGSEG